MKERLTTVFFLLLGVIVAAIGLSVALAAPSADVTERVSVSSSGQQADNSSQGVGVSGNGRYVAFGSRAGNLVPNATGDFYAIYVRDLQANTTERVSIAAGGGESKGNAGNPTLSDDGRYVAFTSNAKDLVAGDTNNYIDAFVYDRQTGKTEIASLAYNGQQINFNVLMTAISGNGRFVIFSTSASNVVPNDNNKDWDIFVRDRQAGSTERVTVSSSGQEGNSSSYYGDISADGRYVAFQSNASNLVPGDTDGHGDVFVRDRQAGKTELISIGLNGQPANADSGSASISADGRYVAFQSFATNLVPGVSSPASRVYVRDRQTGKTELISVPTGGGLSDGPALQPSISGNGRYVTFKSTATNLVPGDTNGMADIFVRDRQAGTTTRVSVSTSGAEGNFPSETPAISNDGSVVGFVSYASTLVPNDTNGKGDIFVRRSAGGGPGPTPPGPTAPAPTPTHTPLPDLPNKMYVPMTTG